MREKETLTVAEVTTLTGLSRQTITRLFEKERGVLQLVSLAATFVTNGQ